MEIREAIEGFKMDNAMLAGTGNDAVIERNNLAIEALEKDEHKCDECAGCTSWKCDCANIREQAITEFAEQLKNKLILKYGNASAAQQYVAMQVTDWCAEIAKELKQ